MQEQSTHPVSGVGLVHYPELAGRVAVVTGAARGMGACFALGLANQGVHVVGLDLDLDTLQESFERARQDGRVATDGAGSLTAMRCDVSDRDSVFQVAADVRTRFGRLDIWVSNAGVFPQTPIAEVTPEEVERTFGVNVDGVIFGAQAAAANMDNGGVIINMASVAAFRVRPGRPIYSASKAAVHNLTQSLAVELGQQGIRVNALAPGFIDTEMTNWVKHNPEAMAKALSTIPLGQIGSPEQVFSALLFLVSDAASYVSGQTLGVDGGSRHG